MNTEVEDFIRNKLKEKLPLLTAVQLNVFYRTDELIESISIDKLEWALTQVNNTLKKNVDKEKIDKAAQGIN